MKQRGEEGSAESSQVLASALMDGRGAGCCPASERNGGKEGGADGSVQRRSWEQRCKTRDVKHGALTQTGGRAEGRDGAENCTGSNEHFSSKQGSGGRAGSSGPGGSPAPMGVRSCGCAGSPAWGDPSVAVGDAEGSGLCSAASAGQVEPWELCGFRPRKARLETGERFFFQRGVMRWHSCPGRGEVSVLGGVPGLRGWGAPSAVMGWVGLGDLGGLFQPL